MSIDPKKSPSIEPTVAPSDPADCKATCWLSCDIAIIIAVILFVLAGNWIGLRLAKALVRALPEKQLGNHAGLVNFPVLAVARGVFQFFCGYLMARWLRQVNPWHVVTGLAIFMTFGILWVTPWAGFAQIARIEKIAVPELLVQSLVGPLCLLLFVSLGIWCYRHQRKRDMGGD